MPKWQQKKLANDPTWEIIRERKIDPDNEIGLPELIDIALTNNPTTREAWLKARAQDANLTKSKSTYYPQVTAQAGMAYDKRVVDKQTSLINQVDDSFSLDVTMLVFDFGGREAGVKKAKQQLLAANYGFNQALQDLLRDIETAYYVYHSSVEGLEAAKDNLSDAKEILLNARERFQVGLVSKLDVFQAEATYNGSLYSLEEAKGELHNSRAAIAETMGVSADTGFKISLSSGKVPIDIREDDVSKYIEKALKVRPDIALARANLKAKEEDVAIATSDLLPLVNIGGSGATNRFQYYGSKKGTPTSYKEDYLYGAQISVDWKVFDGFNNYFSRKEAQREAEAQREQLVQTEISASADVWTRFYDLKTAGKKYVFSEAFLVSATASYELAVEGYKAGLQNILDLLQAQNQLSEARSQFATSKKDLFVALVEFDHAMGALSAGSE